jgi:hypothetical protein
MAPNKPSWIQNYFDICVLPTVFSWFFELNFCKNFKHLRLPKSVEIFQKLEYTKFSHFLLLAKTYQSTSFVPIYGVETYVDNR